MICAAVCMMGVGLAYSPSPSDTALIDKVATMVKSIDTDRLQKVEKKISLILAKSWDRLDDRAYYLLDIINMSVQNTLWDREQVAAERREAWIAYLGISFNSVFSRRGVNGDWYWIRVSTLDQKWNAKNGVLTVSIPRGFCLEYNDSFLPMSMAQYSTNYGLKWRKFSRSLITDDGAWYKLMCDVTSVKVLLPRNMEMFNTSWYWFSAIKKNFARNHVPFCMGVVLSADNAQYEDQQICFHTTPDEFQWAYDWMQKSFGKAKADGDVTVN